MTNSLINDTLTTIRNAVRVKSVETEITKTRITEALTKILLQEGLIDEVVESCSPDKGSNVPSLLIRFKYSGVRKTSIITNVQIVSRPSLRVYTGYNEIPIVFGGLGLVVLSTHRGLMADHEARRLKIGGEVLCSIWLFFRTFISQRLTIVDGRR